MVIRVASGGVGEGSCSGGGSGGKVVTTCSSVGKRW